MPLGALFVEVRPSDWIVLAALYYGRMVGITAGYHRYFAHRTYKMVRVMQFLVALLGKNARNNWRTLGREAVDRAGIS